MPLSFESVERRIVRCLRDRLLDAGGARYIHGGAMLQEIVLPVVTVKELHGQAAERAVVRKVVRKDLTKLLKEGANVPIYVLEYLLGMYCASNDEQVIKDGLENVKRILIDKQTKLVEFFYVITENSCMCKYALSFIRYILAVFSLMLILSFHASFAETQSRANRYVGSITCKNCHEKEFNSFINYAKKSKSFESIERVKKGLTEEEIKGCYFCHTTGYGKPGGFVSIERTPEMKNAGCEVCHGPGELHVKTNDPRYIIRKMTMKDCESCHISERVRAFRYKPLIHGGAH